MSSGSRTIAEFIAELARETHAPASFVDQVSTLFAQKGIPLDAESEPYADAIRQTFLSDERLRESCARAREHLGQLKDRLQRLGESWQRQIEQVQRIGADLDKSLREARAHAAWMQARHGAIPDRAPRPFLVPGPKDLQ